MTSGRSTRTSGHSTDSVVGDLESDPTTNTLYVADNGGTIYGIDQDGNVSDFAAGFFSPDGTRAPRSWATRASTAATT